MARNSSRNRGVDNFLNSGGGGGGGRANGIIWKIYIANFIIIIFVCVLQKIKIKKTGGHSPPSSHIIYTLEKQKPTKFLVT